MLKLPVHTADDGATVTLPPELLDHLHLGRDDALCLCETPEGYLLTRYEPTVAAQLEAAEEIMREDREVLLVLAK